MNFFTNSLKSTEVMFVACNTLACSALVDQDTVLLNELAQEMSLKYLRKLLSVKVSKVGNLTTIEGSTFGYQHVGLFDGSLFVIEKLLKLVRTYLMHNIYRKKRW